MKKARRQTVSPVIDLFPPIGREREMSEQSKSCGRCKDGWICEEHPIELWPHDDCAGPGMQCPNPECPWWKGDPPPARQLDVVYASTSQEPTQKTGLLCPLCVKVYGAIEDQQPKRIVFKCQACGHRWHWDDPWQERS